MSRTKDVDAGQVWCYQYPNERAGNLYLVLRSYPDDRDPALHPEGHVTLVNLETWEFHELYPLDSFWHSATCWERVS